MPRAARVGDKTQCKGHSCHRHPVRHTVTGPGTTGATKTKINGRLALRVGDQGIHSSCSGDSQWIAFRVQGARNIYIEGKQAFAMGDFTKHCGKDDPLGNMIEGSDTVNYGG